MNPRKSKADSRFTAPSIQLRFLVDDMFMGMVLAKQPKGASSNVSLKVINTRDIDSGILSAPDQLDRVELPATSQTDHYRVREGDVLVSARGAFKVARIQNEYIGAVAGPNLIVLRPNPSLKSSLLYAFLRLPDVQAQIQRQSVKTTVASIGIDTIANLALRIPDETKQFELARLIDLTERQYVLGRRMAEIRRTLAEEIITRELIP